MSFNKKTLGALALACSSLLAANYANAALVLLIDNLGPNGLDVGIDAIIVDDADGPIGTLTAFGASNVADTGTGAGVDGFIGFSIGDPLFQFISKVGTSKPLIDDSIDLLSLTLSGKGQFRVVLSDTDFAFDANQTLVSEMGGTTDGTVTWSAYAGMFEGDTSYTTGGPFSAGPGAFSGTSSALLPLSTSTLLADVTIKHNNARDLTTFDYRVKVVPEPAMLGLIGLGLAGIGFTRRKKA